MTVSNYERIYVKVSNYKSDTKLVNYRLLCFSIIYIIYLLYYRALHSVFPPPSGNSCLGNVDICKNRKTVPKINNWSNSVISVTSEFPNTMGELL